MSAQTRIIPSAVVAIIAHVALISLFELEHQGATDKEIFISLLREPTTMKNNPPAEPILETIPSTTQEHDAEQPESPTPERKIKRLEHAKTLSTSTQEINQFVQAWVKQEVTPDKIEAFNKTFSGSQILDLEHKTIIQERADGSVLVTTSLFGSPVCYTFAALGDPPVTNFIECPEKLIKLNIKR